MSGDDERKVLVVGAGGMGGMLAQVAAMSVMGGGFGLGSLLHGPDLREIHIGRDPNDDLIRHLDSLAFTLDAMDDRSRDRMGFRHPRLPMRSNVTHIDTPKVKGKRALRRARGKARS